MAPECEQTRPNKLKALLQLPEFRISNTPVTGWRRNKLEFPISNKGVEAHGRSRDGAGVARLDVERR